MNVERAISEVCRCRGQQQVGVLVNGVLYPILPTLDEVTIGSTAYAAFTVDMKNPLGKPDDDEEASIFSTPKVIKFSNSERALGDARNGNFVILDANLDYTPGVPCMAVLTYDDRTYAVMVYEQVEGKGDFQYNDTGWRAVAPYSVAPADDLDACDNLFTYCGLLTIRG
jgi:hypothetical protein